MKKMIGFLIFLSSFKVLADEPIKVAVIDTGLKLEFSQEARLCPTGHKDFTGEGFNDIHGHGTNIVGLITKHARTTNYCIVLIKAYAFKELEGKPYLTEALLHAYKIQANIINISGGGRGIIPQEQDIINRLLNEKRIIIVSAGNNTTDLDKNCDYYPACYDKRIYVIGSTGINSNYGSIVDTTYDGYNQTGFGVTMSGTSQSTAIFTGLLLKSIDILQKKK